MQRAVLGLLMASHVPGELCAPIHPVRLVGSHGDFLGRFQRDNVPAHERASATVALSATRPPQRPDHHLEGVRQSGNELGRPNSMWLAIVRDWADGEDLCAEEHGGVCFPARAPPCCAR
jgi:hypothetical protein